MSVWLFPKQFIVMSCGFEPSKEIVLTIIILKADLVKMSYFAINKVFRSVPIRDTLWLSHDCSGGVGRIFQK